MAAKYEIPATLYANGGHKTVLVDVRANTMHEATAAAEAKLKHMGHTAFTLWAFGPPPDQAVADAADFERRWLEECRAHGETKRKLRAVRHQEAGLRDLPLECQGRTCLVCGTDRDCEDCPECGDCK